MKEEPRFSIWILYSLFSETTEILFSKNSSNPFVLPKKQPENPS